jgi:hypothetical protein
MAHEHEARDTTAPAADPGRASLNAAAELAKEFYSAGSSFTALGCSAAVLIGWTALARLWHVFESTWVSFLLSALIVYAYALLLPEPDGYPDARKMKLTAAEGLFGFFNTLIVFATVLGVKDGFKLF